MGNPIDEFMRSGISVRIELDEPCESPDDWGDEDLFLVAFHEDFTVSRTGYDRERAVEVLTNGGDDDHFAFGLEAYIHSGVVLALSGEGPFPDRRWDVSQLGIVLASREDFKTRENAKRASRDLLTTWNMYLSGEVYGYVLTDEDGKPIDSCWQIYGMDNAVYKAKEAADDAARRRAMSRQARLKRLIKSNVPLIYR